MFLWEKHVLRWVLFWKQLVSCNAVFLINLRPFYLGKEQAVQKKKTRKEMREIEKYRKERKQIGRKEKR